MILHAFCILDTKTGIHNAPFFVPHPGAAVRAFKDLATDLSTQIGRHPADFTLICIGQFDDQTGRMEQLPFAHFGTAVSYIEPANAAFRMEDVTRSPRVSEHGAEGQSPLPHLDVRKNGSASVV